MPNNFYSTLILNSISIIYSQRPIKVSYQHLYHDGILCFWKTYVHGMKLYQFKLLDISEQNTILQTHGIYLGERIDGQYKFKPYQIDDFYVEEMWHVPFNERRAITTFVTVDKLQPYLEVIDISTLPH